MDIEKQLLSGDEGGSEINDFEAHGFYKDLFTIFNERHMRTRTPGDGFWRAFSKWNKNYSSLT